MGLLTGDNSINGEAPVVVMTTEVLRNMLYAGSPTLAGLGYVVLDEVHYLADAFRGAVWEEVIIHLPESVRLVALSATVSNAEEFGDWLSQVRGGTTVIVDEHRPVPLWQHMLVGGRLYDLFTGPDGTGRPRREPPEGEPGAAPARAARARRTRSAGGGAGRRRPAAPGPPGPVPRGPGRPEVIDRLDAAGLLPAITFIFSRAGCDAAVLQCLNAGLRLTTPDEAERDHRGGAAADRGHPPEDLPVLGYADWLAGLQRGIAAHHAGMLPTFKEVVEELFAAGLIRAVFATETLALGINMPARTVVIERLDKWNGENHADLTPGEYTQLTGRAGRRGIDVEGHAVVLWQPGVDPRGRGGPGRHPDLPAELQLPAVLQHGGQPGRPGRPAAGRRAAGVLVRAVPGGPGGGRHRPPGAPDPAVDGAARGVLRPRRLRRVPGAAPGTVAARGRAVPAALGGPAGRGRGLARAAAPGRHRPGAGRPPGRDRAGARAPARLPGPPHSSSSLAAADSPELLVLTAGRQVKRLTLADFPVPVTPIDRVRIPAWFSARSAKHRRDLASTVRNKLAGHDLARPPRPAVRSAAGDGRGPRAGCGGGCASTRATAARTARSTPGRPSGTTGWSGRPTRWSAGWRAART